MSTASDLIRGSLRLIGAVAPGETPTSAEIDEGLSALNEMVDSWSNDGHMIFEEKRESFTLSSGTADYTIGSGADFDTARPQIVLRASAKEIGDETELPVAVIYESDEWQRISYKTTQSEIALAIYWQPEYPNGKISIWPVPNAASTLILYSLKPLSTFATSATTVSLPPGYYRALRYNLAVELAAEYGRELDPRVDRIAVESKAALARLNTRPVLLKNDAAELNKRKTFNWKTGE